MSTEQLSFNFPENPPPEGQVVARRDGEVLFRINSADPDTLRKRLIERLKQSPLRPRLAWESYPRPTGWFGVKNVPYLGTSVYEITVSPIKENQQ